MVDLWKAFMAKTGWTEENWKQGEPLVGSLDVEQNQELVRLMHDGLHFNAAGYQVLFGEFLKVVRENIAELAPENLPLLLPVWNDAKAWEEWDAAQK